MGIGARCLVPIRRGILAAALGAVLLAALVPATAEATTSCEYNGGAEVLIVTMSETGDGTLLAVGPSNEIQVRGGGPVLVCSGGAATTTNTDQVNVFDNSGAGTSLAVHDTVAFAVLKIVDATGSGNDEFALFGDDGGGQIIAGANGANTDGDLANEVSFIGTPEHIELLGGSGADTISARGGGETGPVLNGPAVEIQGAAGNDSLDGSETGDLITGDDGNDTMRGFGGNDAFTGDGLSLPGNDSFDGGAGSDTVRTPLALAGITIDLAKSGPQPTGKGDDSFTEIENVSGTSFADTLLGTAGANNLQGEGGDDLIDGRAGDDQLSGSSGIDTLTYADAPAGVAVDLGSGTASGGDGKDSLDLGGFENLIGSQFADSLTGSAAANSITALGGSDTVQALAGPDRVDVRDGAADNASCGSEIDTAIADRLSLDAVQADCELIDALPEPEQPGASADGNAGGKGGNPGGNGSKGQPKKDSSVKFSLRAAKRQPLLAQGGVIVKLRCPQEACKVAVRGGRRLKPVTVHLARATTKTVKLKIRKAKRPAIRRLLFAGGTLKLRLTATATDAAGNSAPAKLTVTATPPLRHR